MIPLDNITSFRHVYNSAILLPANLDALLPTIECRMNMPYYGVYPRSYLIEEQSLFPCLHNQMLAAML